MLMKKLEWDVAEVLEYERTYQYVPSPTENSNLSELFALRVRSCGEIYNQKVYIAKPGNLSIKKIPLVGEFVLIYKTFNQQSTDKKFRESWYYLSTVDLQSSINENMIPGISGELTAEQINTLTPGKSFSRKSVSPIQPYEGDVIIEGRSGNSIRFGSSIETMSNTPAGYYYKSPTWQSTQTGDPIIVLSNRLENQSLKEFVVENINSDASSLYLTSTQELNNLQLTKPLTIHNSFNGSQFVGIADRIILRAKRDLAVIDSEKGIILNTPNNIYIGGENASQPLVHGDVLVDILSKILDQLQFVPIQCGELTGGFLSKTQLNSARQKLNDLVSSKYRMEFNPRK